MKKIIKLATLFLAVGSIVGGATIGISNAKNPANYQNTAQNAIENEKAVGDLLGSVNVKAPGYGGFNVSTNSAKLGSDGVYMRIRNNANEAQYLVMHINSTDGVRITNKVGETFKLYDQNGENPTTGTITNVDHGYITIPANFNGFLFMPMTSFELNTWWDGYWFGDTYPDNPATYAIYVEGVMLDMDFGDIFTTTVTIFDGSEYYPQDTLGKFSNDWGCELTVNDGGLVPETPVDYAAINYLGDMNKGVAVGAVQTKDDVVSTFRINLPSVADISDAKALTLMVKCLSGTYPYFLRVVDSDGNRSQLPSRTSDKKPMYFNGKTLMNASYGGNDNSIYYPSNFEGQLIVLLESLLPFNGVKADLTKVSALEIGIAVKFDYNFKGAFGDVGVVKVIDNTPTHYLLLDCEQGVFSEVFTVSEYGQYLDLSTNKTPQPCEWIGDVKILNSLKYENNEDLKREVTWNIGDNACSYEVMNDGMFVRIGPFETGHQFGSYMCLQMPETGANTDRKVWSREVNGVKEYAKGITMYVKNLSVKEIGITLQFDELTTSNTFERWCITGYPAMYYAWDVVTGAEFTYYCKSDQFQIPVGFEGYVRIPFESYRVPDWCAATAGVDNVIDLDRFSGTFYLTSDNTRFEDLEYFIKNVGIYFNETRKSTLFDDSNSIKSNMGL